MTTKALKIDTGIEPIPGYRILRKLGAGGYGEVWSAEAPGGMEKAIKFVFGSHDSDRGARELRSLNRIKSVNHPFLLSLERFEIINGQLIIVTELASGSLEDVLEKHRQRGAAGIPRKDLLGYLHDAADGLDYLHDEFQLQHLDVKPGNLLIVGGHVKVGDFGLLKDLGDVDCSMVGGLTPIYAAPEVFDGRPHHNSDQYSLAIMYQELLTSHRPFAGRTIAQLATQHVHSAPNLEALPPSDRPVIARALEKDPTRRYANCRELIDRLKRSNEQPIRIPVKDKAIDGNTQSIDRLGEASSSLNRPAVDNLPKLDSQSLRSVTTNRALVVGLGGIGRAVMQQLCVTQSQCNDQFHDLQGLLIDTDDAEMYAFREFEFENNLICNVQRACFPLKSPHDYRETSSERFSTISRRWIYNVPKTRKTEGLRPLGRLALIDHAAHLKRMLEQAVSELSIDPETNAQPRVYVVGSLFGGTASGMYLDVTFMLRHLLDKHQLAEIEVRPLLLASVPTSTANAEPLAIASTHAALSEMHYFLQPNKGYPADPVNELESVPAARTPLPAAYVAAAASGQDGVQLLADYLWSDAFVAPAVIDEARKSPDKGSSNRIQPMLRSFGAAPLQVRPSVDLQGLKKRSIDRLIRGWMGDPKTLEDQTVDQAVSILESIGVSPVAWADCQIQQLLQKEVSVWRKELEAAILEDLKGLSNGGSLVAKEAVIAARTRCQSMLAAAAKSRELSGDLPEFGSIAIEKLQRYLHEGLQEKRLDLSKVVGLLRAVGKKCFEYAQQNETDLATLKQDANSVFQRLMSDLTTTEIAKVDLTSISEAMIQLMRADLQTPNGIVFEEFGDEVNRMHQRLLDQAKRLASVHQQLHAQGMPKVSSENSVERKILPRVVDDLWRQFTEPFILNALVGTKQQNEPDATADETLARFSDAASAACERLLDDTSGDGILSADELKSHIEKALKQSYPALLRFGGKRRLILVGEDRKQLDALKPVIEQIIGGEITVVASANAKTMIVHEASEIPIESILGNLVGTLGADLTIAGRLLSRCDIQWTQPTEQASTARSVNFPNPDRS
ncbi:MAG: tubulin-like doman-containing protein [Pirellulaceae bacterium]